MEIVKNKLEQALNIVKYGLALNEIIPFSTWYNFTQGALITYNDKVAVTVPIGLSLEGSVPSKVLVEFLKRCTGDVVKLSLSDNEQQITLKVKRSRATLPFSKGITLPLEDLQVKHVWKKVPSDFYAALKFAKPAIATNDTMGTVCYANIRQNEIQTTDTFTLISHKIESNPVHGYLLHRNSVGILLQEKPKYVAAIQNGWIFFKTASDVVFSFRILDTKWVDAAPYLRAGTPVFTLKLPEDMSAVVQRAMPFIEPTDRINVSLKGRAINVSVQSTHGAFTERLRSEIPGDMQISTMPEHLLQIIKDAEVLIVEQRLLRVETDRYIMVTVLHDTQTDE